MGELFASINGFKICYEIHGDGFPLVLLHGFAMYKEFWIAQIKSLSEKFKIIILDNRGCGNSDHPKENFDMDRLADDLKALLDYLNIEQVHIAGHSLGGMYAQHFALQYPNRLKKLILLATLANLPLDTSGLEMYKRSQLDSYNLKLKDPTQAFYNKMKQRFSRNSRKS
jgi:3-oxoadipate enol-lactonase